MTFDIGHPLYAATNVINDNQNGDIFCRGYSSCAAVDTMKTNYGNIHCWGYQSCMDVGLLWTDDSDSIYVN